LLDSLLQESQASNIVYIECWFEDDLGFMSSAGS